MADPDRTRSATGRYRRATQLLLAANGMLFVVSMILVTANPVLSLVTGGLNAVALGALVWVDRRVVRSGVPSFWRDGRLSRPDRDEESA